MRTKVTKQQFAEKVSALVKNFAEAKQQEEASRKELERIFGRGWVMALESIVDEDRVLCSSCNCDVNEFDIDHEGRCFSCSRDAGA